MRNKYRNCKTYIINDRDLCGGRNYTEYTWKEVLNYFCAPEDIESIDELVDWLERDGMRCQYLIEDWHEYDQHGWILA